MTRHFVTNKFQTSYQMNDNDTDTSINNENIIDNSTDCCIWNISGTCNSNCNQSKYFFLIFNAEMMFFYLKLNQWPRSAWLIIDLNENMTEHMRHLNVIRHNHVFEIPVLECDLILNRPYQHVDVTNVDLKTCSLHRYTFGIGWRIHNRCYQMDHNISFQQSSSIKRRKSSSENKMWVATFHLAEKIVVFSVMVCYVINIASNFIKKIGDN